jgi:hypothetical protein
MPNCEKCCYTIFMAILDASVMMLQQQQQQQKLLPQDRI